MTNLDKVDELTINQFIHEIEILERLPFSPYICRYLFHERKPEMIRMFMSRYSTSLRLLIANKKHQNSGRFDRGKVAYWASQIASGVVFLHENKIMHRDIKSDNILVNLDSQKEISKLVITDFDTATRVNKTELPNTVVGTPSYTAPEVYKVKTMGPYDYRADVWSFGMVLYELMTLRRPYDDVSDRFKVPELVMAGQRPPTEDLGYEWRDLVSIFQACTEPDVNSRPHAETIRDRLFYLYKQFT